jgi:hypothetical protein
MVSKKGKLKENKINERHRMAKFIKKSKKNSDSNHSRLQSDYLPRAKQAPEESGDRGGIGESLIGQKFNERDWNEISKIGREE